jgi:transposase
MDRDTLYRLYVVEQKTTIEIAIIAGVRSSQTICNWLKKHGIQRRSYRDAQRATVPTAEELRELYVNQGMSIDAIWHVLGSSESSISRLLDEYGIPKRANTTKFAGWNKGKSITIEQRQSLSEQAKQRIGEKSPRYGVRLNEETRNRIANSLKGRFRGAQNPFWKGGSEDRRNLWHSRFEYKEWRKSVFARDDYTCQMCGKRSNGDIQAHHILPWRIHPETRFDVANGITLCVACHLSIRGKESEYARQFQAITHQPTP